jgi:hypothetical protein
MKTRKSWLSKLADDHGLPKVVPITKKMSVREGDDALLADAEVRRRVESQVSRRHSES